MSKGIPDADLRNTAELLAKVNPLNSEGNWLRHGKGDRGRECAVIDALLLTGLFTKDEIAKKIARFSKHNSENFESLRGRVTAHISHLERTANGAMAPHRLEVTEDDLGCLSFTILDSE